MNWKNDERVKQVAIGVSILGVITALVVGALLGWRSLPGLLGQWIGTVIGIMTTPIFMEISFSVMALIGVVTLNTWRKNRDGEEFVDPAELAEREPAVGDSAKN